jgi:hypothetical protein
VSRNDSMERQVSRLSAIDSVAGGERGELLRS